MYAAAIDLGGTKIEGAIVDEKGEIHSRKRIATQAEKGKKQVLKNIFSVINFLKENFKQEIKGVGIATPGFVDKTGKIIFGGAALKCLAGVNLKKELKKKFDLPVFIENDANCFALAEAVYGSGKTHKVVLGIIWGTGIGLGIVIDRKVYSGAFGAAGEFGHICLEPRMTKGPKCGCGQHACLENLASGKNISRIYRQKGGKIKNADPQQIYESKEVIAQKVISDALHYLGLGLCHLVNILNPDVIVLGGGVSKFPSPVYKKLEKEIKKYALPILTKKLKIVRHEISDAAGVLGAAALVFEN